MIRLGLYSAFIGCHNLQITRENPALYPADICTYRPQDNIICREKNAQMFYIEIIHVHVSTFSLYWPIYTEESIFRPGAYVFMHLKQYYKP